MELGGLIWASGSNSTHRYIIWDNEKEEKWTTKSPQHPVSSTCSVPVPCQTTELLHLNQGANQLSSIKHNQSTAMRLTG